MTEGGTRLRPITVVGRGLLAMRWLALLATFFLSLHHWMRAGYWEFSGIWQYGLPILDPRFAAALIWWLLSAAFWVLVALPLANWLAQQLPVPASSRDLRIATAVLALGMGTRGVVGPLILRAAFGLPMTLMGPGEPPTSALNSPYLARWLVLLAQAWWVVPLLVAGLWLLGPRTTSRPSVRWAIRGLLIFFALCQPIDAAYLLTAGGPHGATQSLPLLAFQEGFGRQEFGYASVLTVLLCFAVLPLAPFLCVPLRPVPSTPRGSSDDGQQSTARRVWPMLAVVGMLPLLLAWSRQPVKLTAPLGAWLAMSISLILAVTSGLWSGALGGALARSGGQTECRVREWARNSALLFPAMVLILPMIRPWGYRTGVAEAGLLVLGMVVAAPHLLLSTVTAELLLRRGSPTRLASRVSGLVVAWAVWTELGVDLMLSQTLHSLLPLQGWMVWNLSTALRASPLAVPGWTLAWVGGTALAWVALDQLFSVAISSPNTSDQIPAQPSEL